MAADVIQFPRDKVQSHRDGFDGLKLPERPTISLDEISNIIPFPKERIADPFEGISLSAPKDPEMEKIIKFLDSLYEKP